MYEFSSKSQLRDNSLTVIFCCWRYCKCTSFQANHNLFSGRTPPSKVVGDTANVRVFKQITTSMNKIQRHQRLLAILQMYEFSSKSQLCAKIANKILVVGDTANVRVFKQITTARLICVSQKQLLAILQMYEFSSKSQLVRLFFVQPFSCWRYCKCTSFQANHNQNRLYIEPYAVVGDTANVRVFKQITTYFDACR